MIARLARRLYLAGNRWLASLCHRRVRTLSFNRPVLSITFDDFPRSAATTGAALVEQYGGRATFYTATDYESGAMHFGPMYTASDIADLVQRGHEIACHGHKHYDCITTPVDVLLNDLSQNRQALMALGAPPPVSFAFPYGHLSPNSKGAYAAHMQSHRMVTGGIHTHAADLNQLKAVGVEGPDALQKGLKALYQGQACKGWVIFYTHDVTPTPTQWGITPDDLEALLKAAVELGYEIRTVGNVVQSLANNNR